MVIDVAIGLGAIATWEWVEPEVRIVASWHPAPMIEVQAAGFLGAPPFGGATSSGKAVSNYIWGGPIERVQGGVEVTVGAWPVRATCGELSLAAGVRAGGTISLYDHYWLGGSTEPVEDARVGWTVAGVVEMEHRRLGVRVRLGTTQELLAEGVLHTRIQPGIEGFLRW